LKTFVTRTFGANDGIVANAVEESMKKERDNPTFRANNMPPSLLNSILLLHQLGYKILMKSEAKSYFIQIVVGKFQISIKET
jgi:hypothetical protein